MYRTPTSKLTKTFSARLFFFATRARRRLKSLMRKAFANHFWLSPMEIQELTNNVTKNIRVILAAKKLVSPLTAQAKGILSKEISQRTDEDKTFLFRAIGGLKCFRRYPRRVRKQLSGVTQFVFYGPGRTIVRQHEKGHALYFILLGTVHITVTAWNPVEECVKTEIVGTMGIGDMFGEVSLLHGVSRIASVVTESNCEFCMLTKPNFDLVLKETVEHLWDEIKLFMSYFDYFKDWDDITLREACILSQVQRYKYKEIIIGEDVGFHSCVYFVIEGKCDIIQYTPIQRVYDSKGLKKYRLYPTQSHKNKKIEVEKLPNDVEPHFFRLATLNELATFNVGENIDNRFFIAKTDNVTCLLIPQYWLFQRKQGDLWNKLASFLNRHIPNPSKVFTHFLEQKKWDKYKKKLFNDILGQCSKFNNNHITNVPYSIRMAQDVDFYFP